MKIHWLYLLLALALLLPPTPFPIDFRKALRRSDVYLGGVTGIWQNWLDLIRGALGAYFLTAKAIVVLKDALPGTEFKALALEAALLGVVLLVQTIRMLHTVQLLAPVFYLCGLTLMMGGFDDSFFRVPLPISGAFAVGVGWLFAVGGQNLTYQLPGMAVAAAIAGGVLGPMLPLMLTCALILVPLILGTLLKKRLWFATTVRVGG